MKFARPLFITLVVLGVCSAASLAVLLSPSFQRWAILRAMAGQPELKFEVSGISAGLSRLEISDVALAPSGVQVKASRLVADYNLWAFVWDRRIEIDRLQVDGLVLDITKKTSPASSAKAAGAPVIAPGLLGQLKLPYAFALRECRIEGQLLLPLKANEQALPVTFQITGGDFAPGGEGTLVLTTKLKNPDLAAPVSALNTQVRLQVLQTEGHAFGHILLSAVVDADGKTIAGQNQLKIITELSQQATGEHHRVEVATLADGKSDQLLTVQATLPTGASTYAGQWTLKAEAAQLRPYLLGKGLPEFAAAGQGNFEADPVRAALDCRGELAVSISRLEAIEPAWRAFGAVKCDAKFDVALAEGVVSLRRVQVDLAGENPVLQLKVTPGLRVDLKKRRLGLADGHGGELLNFKLLGLPLAWVRPFIKTVDISGDRISGEWLLGLLPGGQVRLGSVQPLKIDGLNVVQAGKLLLGKADLSTVLEANLVDKVLTVAVPDFSLSTPAGDSLKVQAKVVYPMAAPSAASLETRYEFNFPQLLAPWIALGHVQGGGVAELELTGKKLALRRLETVVNNASGGLLVKADLITPFAVALDTLAVSDSPAKTTDLLRINLGRVNLGALPVTEPGTRLEGAIEPSSWTLSAFADKLRLSAVDFLKITGVSLSAATGPLATKLSVEAQPQIELGPKMALRVQSGEVAIRTQAGASLATIKLDADGSPQTDWRASVAFGLEIPQLATQPMFAGVQAVSAGRASGEVRVAIAQRKQVEARLTVNGLVDRQSGQTLPVANLSFQGTVEPSGKISIKAPLLLDRAGKRSDLLVGMDVTPEGPNFVLNGSVTGDQLEVGDILALAGVFSAPAKPAPKTTVPPTKIMADKVPIWAHYRGQLQLALKSISRGQDWVMTGLNGDVQIEPGSITLHKLEAAFGEKGRLAAQGGVTFTAGAAQPYELGGKFSVTEFDAGRLFKALEPGKPATVDGLFSISAEFAGRGETLPRVVERANGRFLLTSREGVFRGLQRTTNKVSKTTKAVELGASVLGSLFGSDNVTKAAEKVAGTAYFVDQLAAELAEIKYDQLSVRLTRDTALNLKLEDLSLVAPEIRLMGQGSITYSENKSLLEQPLSASLNLAARGKMEELLGKLKLLGSARDELGYAKARETLTVGGTIAKPDPSAFFTKIAAGKLTDFLGGD